METMNKETITNNLNLENQLIIFPKYTVALIRNGYKVKISGKRASDVKIVSYIYGAEMEGTPLEELPEIAVYDTNNRCWHELYCTEVESDVLIIENGKYGDFKYYLRKLDEIEDAVAVSISNYITQFSSAELNIAI